MNIVRISATSARNNFFELLTKVSLGTQVIIEKDNKEIAVISQKTKTNWANILKASKAVHGILKDVSIEEIDPVKDKQAWGRIGGW